MGSKKVNFNPVAVSDFKYSGSLNLPGFTKQRQQLLGAVSSSANQAEKNQLIDFRASQAGSGLLNSGLSQKEGLNIRNYFNYAGNQNYIGANIDLTNIEREFGINLNNLDNFWKNKEFEQKFKNSYYKYKADEQNANSRNSLTNTLIGATIAIASAYTGGMAGATLSAGGTTALSLR